MYDVRQASEQSLAKTDQLTFGSDVVVIIYLMMELLIGDGYHSLPLYVYVCVDVGKSGHINGNQIITIII